MVEEDVEDRVATERGRVVMEGRELGESRGPQLWLNLKQAEKSKMQINILVFLVNILSAQKLFRLP